MIRIISDSTCDLSSELLKRYGVTIIPLHILLHEHDHLDGQSITPDEIYRWAEANKTTPKTAAVSVNEALHVFKTLLAAGDEAICFSISSNMSGTWQNMLLAARELHAEDRIQVIDSQNLSTGIGLLVIAAAEMAQQGLPLPEIVCRINALIPRVRSSFVVDTLTYLHRGGRCSGLAALAGGALKLHPRISVSEGGMAAGKKYRGRMNSVLLDYVADLRSELLSADAHCVFITHSGCDETLITSIRQELEALHRFAEIHVTRAGGVISSHCGPGTLGVLYIAAPNS